MSTQADSIPSKFDELTKALKNGRIVDAYETARDLAQRKLPNDEAFRLCSVFLGFGYTQRAENIFEVFLSRQSNLEELRGMRQFLEAGTDERNRGSLERFKQTARTQLEQKIRTRERKASTGQGMVSVTMDRDELLSLARSRATDSTDYAAPNLAAELARNSAITEGEAIDLARCHEGRSRAVVVNAILHRDPPVSESTANDLLDELDLKRDHERISPGIECWEKKTKCTLCPVV